ncbi:hypothetical protein [Streptomyces sp. NPDC053560]|uniref:hypothetical protein n=1 Tax=Streptomyces sp. NPDC053560 TaxID=3365711 RepID=UPI0037D0725A
MPVSPARDEALHDAVLNYLYRLAMATGHPVRALVHDARSGYLTPIEVQTDGSSHFAGEPEQVAPPAASTAAPAPSSTPPQAQTQAQTPSSTPVPSPPSPPAPDTQARPHPQQIEQQGAPPTGQPVEQIPEPAPHAPVADPRTAAAGQPAQPPQPAPAAYGPSVGHGVPAQQPAPRPGATAPPTIPPALADAVTRINDAVQLGRLEFAAATANSALSTAVQEFGIGHPYVLHLQELFAHIAYLAHDSVKSVAIYLDVFGHRYKQNDPTAYDTFMRAAKAWSSIRDPQQGLVYGQQLINTWTELARPGGPAAADGDKIEAARKRLTRLAQHAAHPGQPSA